MIDLPHKVALEWTEGTSVENSLKHKKKKKGTICMNVCLLLITFQSVS